MHLGICCFVAKQLMDKKSTWKTLQVYGCDTGRGATMPGQPGNQQKVCGNGIATRPLIIVYCQAL